MSIDVHRAALKRLKKIILFPIASIGCGRQPKSLLVWNRGGANRFRRHTNKTALSDVHLRGLKPTKKSFKVGDPGGLFVLVNPNGSKPWRLAYRYQGKQKLLALGAYPTISLGDARKATRLALER
jgi:hypothetical protein